MTKKRRDVVLYGIGKMTEYVTKVIEKNGLFDISAYTADPEFVDRTDFMSRPLVAFDEVESIYPPDDFLMLVLIGYKNMRNREKMFSKAKNKGYTLPNCIAGNVYYFDDLCLGENNMIFSGSYIDVNTNIGNNNIIRPNVYIGHDIRIGDHCYIAPGCHIAGGSILEDMSFIGLGTNIIGGRLISRENLIGAGSLVIRDTEPFSKYFGNPALKKGSHEEEGIIF